MEFRTLNTASGFSFFANSLLFGPDYNQIWSHDWCLEAVLRICAKMLKYFGIVNYRCILWSHYAWLRIQPREKCIHLSDNNMSISADNFFYYVCVVSGNELIFSALILYHIRHYGLILILIEFHIIISAECICMLHEYFTICSKV